MNIYLVQLPIIGNGNFVRVAVIRGLGALVAEPQVHSEPFLLVTRPP